MSKANLGRKDFFELRVARDRVHHSEEGMATVKEYDTRNRKMADYIFVHTKETQSNDRG